MKSRDGIPPNTTRVLLLENRLLSTHLQLSLRRGTFFSRHRLVICHRVICFRSFISFTVNSMSFFSSRFSPQRFCPSFSRAIQPTFYNLQEHCSLHPVHRPHTPSRYLAFLFLSFTCVRRLLSAVTDSEPGA